MQSGKLIPAKKILQTSLDGAKPNSPQVGEIHSLLGQVYRQIGDPKRAGLHCSECLRIRQGFSDHRGIADIKGDIGELLVSAGFIDSARVFLADALGAKTMDYGCDDVEVAHSLCSMAKLLVKGEPKEAQRYLQEGEFYISSSSLYSTLLKN